MTKKLLLALALLAAPAFAQPPRLSYMRTIPPRHDLGHPEHIAVIYAIGDSNTIVTFLDIFVDHVSRDLHIENVVQRGPNFIGTKPDDATLRRLRRDHPADIYLGVNVFTCSTEERGAEGSEHDVDGSRVKRHHVWADARCSARIDVLDGATAKRRFSFQVKGEGTSPRVAQLTDEERNIALEQAARYAALEAEEAITPRRVRESIELDETAPSFSEGLSMIESGRFADARAIWEAALRQHRDSAALEFNLGAVSEAIGDMPDAKSHYEHALALSPQERRYQHELNAFRKRTE